MTTSDFRPGPPRTPRPGDQEHRLTTNPYGRCRWCARPLRDWFGQGRGYGGDGEFCTLRCGYRWALDRIQKGRPE